MRCVSQALRTLLHSGTRRFHSVDLLRIELVTGQRLMIAGGDVDVLLGYRDAVVNGRPVVYYPLDGDANDETPEERNGTISGTPTYQTWDLDGSGDQAFDCNVGASIDCGTRHAYVLPYRWSVACWFRRTATGSGFKALVLDEDSSGGDIFSLWFDYDESRIEIQYQYAAGGNNLKLASQARIPAGIWIHVVCTFDGTDLSLYINGALDNRILDASPAGGFSYSDVMVPAARLRIAPTGNAPAWLAHVAVYDYPLRIDAADWLAKVGLGLGLFSVHDCPATRSSLKCSIGLEVDDLELTLSPRDTDLLTLHGSTTVTLRRAISNGALAGARVLLYQAFGPGPPAFPGAADDWPSPVLLDTSTVPARWRPSGALLLYAGYVGPVSVTDSTIEVTCKSSLARLSRELPRFKFKPGCLWELYSRGCGVASERADLRFSGTATHSSTRSMLYSSRSPGKDSGFYDLGQIQMTSGSNAFVRRAIKQHAGSFFTLARPLPYDPEPGDTFVALPGCSKTMAACEDKFGNLARFRGFPFVPEPDTLVGVPLKEV